MNIAHPLGVDIKSATFACYTSEEIKKLSAKEINNSIIFDTLGLPTSGGLYDPALGPFTQSTICESCGLDQYNCPGHFGHIQLPCPVYNPVFFNHILVLLKATCINCDHFKLTRTQKFRFAAKFKLLRHGLILESKQLDGIVTKNLLSDEEDQNDENDDNKKNEKNKSKNIFDENDNENEVIDKDEDIHIIEKYVNKCLKNEDNKIKYKITAINVERKNLMSEFLNKCSSIRKCGNCLANCELRNHFRVIFENESEICNVLYGSQGILNNDIAVPPTRFRPASLLNDLVMENPQNEHLTKILKVRQQFCSIAGNLDQDNKKTIEENYSQEQKKKSRENLVESLMKCWIDLQDAVNGLIDNSKAPVAFGKVATPGIKQILEKKEGLFRKHLMIPEKFAKKLTYPEPVTPYNVNELSQAVSNGPNIWPGATFIQNEDGSMINLASLSLESRISYGQQLMREQQQNTMDLTQYFVKTPYINKKIFRHLRNGDFVLLNRQPTLHKPSIMAHRVRVLKGEMTIRMHYANCNTYNADFDGDEMNLHFPQNEIARSESMLIGNTNNQYLGPTSGSPLRGLIQDHVVTGVWMTIKDTFFNKADYQQMIFFGLRPDPDDSRKIITITPAIIKPKPLWTGKQVISTILKNLTIGYAPLNLTSKNKVSNKYWGWSAMEEDTVIFLNGELLTGVLDKSQIGATSYGLIHSCYELYSADIAGQLLSILGRLFTCYIQQKGFSCRMDDLRLNPEGDKGRKELLNDNHELGKEASWEFVGIDSQIAKNYNNMMEEVIRDSEKHEALDATMKSKVNKLTSNVITKCIPDGLLKVFPQNNMQTMTITGAKGSNVNVSQISCCLGQQELEGRRVPVMVSGKTLPSFLPYDLSARAGGFIGGRFLTGREGLIDTAVKTSRSGYLQRCLIKHLESLRVHYDYTVRDGDGSIIQFRYGEDSLDVIKQKHLYKFEFLAQNFQALLQKYDIVEAQQILNTTQASIHAKKAAKKPNQYDPVLSIFSPSRYLGCVSENFHNSLEEFTKEENPSKIFKKIFQNGLITKPGFRKLMHLKYLSSLVEPGEAVGLLAAQGIGEPSTQMTLNTFHFAGFGAKNVTLGIPRLREIIMTASRNIKTPMMTLPLLNNITDKESNEFCQKTSKLTLAEIIDQMEVTEIISNKRDYNNVDDSGYNGDNGGRNKIYKIHMIFYTQEEYKKEFNIKPWQIERTIKIQFLFYLENEITKQFKGSSKNIKKLEMEDIGHNNGRPIKRSRNEEILDDNVPINDVGYESDNGDGDATYEKINSRTRQFATKQSTQTQTIYVTNCQFDEDDDQCDIELKVTGTKKLLLLAIAESASKRSVIREIKGINKCYPISNDDNNKDDNKKILATEGVNFHSIWRHDNIIDVNKIYSNDIVAILETYGVEAARNAIIKEISDVFSAYGIEVDPRHLLLVADYMMSFETTCYFLTQATLFGDVDVLNSPSARLVLGKVVQGGTGSFEIRQPLKFIIMSSSHRHESPPSRLKRRHKSYYNSKKLKKKHHKHRHNHHSENVSASEEERKQPPTFITEDDYFLKSVEFRLWIREKKKKYFDELSSEQAHRYFKKFVNAWNKYKLDKKYYEGLRSSQLTSSETTRYKWKNLKMENRDQDQLEEVKNIVDRQTNVKFASEFLTSNKGSNFNSRGGRPTLPESFIRGGIGGGDEEDMDEEDKRRYERSLKKKERISFQKTQEVVMDELVPKATEAMIEKKRARNEYYRREESPDMVLNDSDLLGDDNYRSRIAARDRARESRDQKREIYKSEKAKNLQEKSIAYKTKEQETMEMFKQMAEEQRKMGGGLFNQQQQQKSSYARKDSY
ncbi:11893_t:CDS:10 [Diversispora eburnea]|uniref:DNA-directed RNA polymerase subunit n=1 Tax=Diversispora eburnea TaxID=1213867 RepID=A0A9N9B7P8_9GLOM|nr:11893_t:CDS:10 [Diversispora eburnea]